MAASGKIGGLLLLVLPLLLLRKWEDGPYEPPPFPPGQPKMPPPPPAAKPPAAKPPPGAAKPPAAKDWREELLKAGVPVRFQADRQYAAVVELTGLQAMAASRQDVIDELRKVVDFDSITVWDDAAAVPKAWPHWQGQEPKNESGRFWVLAVPSKNGEGLPPPELKTLFSRVWL